ncbi:MAG TPA: DNA repair ATPase [Thermoanaerobaculia bacterium]|nr:DNA repair ATPase [Thermoanaerobaculia bacterium]
MTDPQPPAIERGTYEVIRDRLLANGKVLSAKAEALNKRRIEVFGGTETALLRADRIRTHNNCVPRDIVEVGNRLLFGYNVFIGLKTETQVRDVFSLHEFEEFHPVPDDATDNFLRDEGFARDFRELYQYYRNSRLLQLRRVEGKLLAIFQTSDQVADLRVFRWAVGVDGKVTYIDNRGERDHVFPPSHDFEWTATTRADYVSGDFPHVSILDKVFVETVGGDLTIKIEDNTESGQGIYSEPVEEPDQALDDAHIHYAEIGVLILLKVLPYREKSWRYFVFNKRTRSVRRIDAVGSACIQLPEDHGIIFPGGYYLRTGEAKIFDHDPREMEFLRLVRAPNGEDVLYVFHRRDTGHTLLLPYNVIRKEVVNPLACHGYSLFDDGRMVVFQAASEEPTRVHPMQIWQTPFVSDEHAAKAPVDGSYLARIGNRDLVRGLSDVLSICRLIDEQTPTRATYEDLVAAAGRIVDAYYWLGHAETGDLLSALREVRATAEQILDEFDKVEALRAQAGKAADDARRAVGDLFAKIRPEGWTSIDDYVGVLSQLRSQQGHVISLRETRYIDRAALDALEQEIVARFDEVSRRTVVFLQEEQALAAFAEKTAGIEGRLQEVTKTPEAEALTGELEGVVGSLNLLTEIIGSLEIDDPTVRITILERISALLGGLNRVRALIAQRRKELLGKELVAEFGVQFQLFAQTVTNALSTAGSPERCDAELSKLMLQLEELETRFSEFDEYLAQLGTKREEVYEAFSARKQGLLDQRQRRAEQLGQAAARILQGIIRRAQTFAGNDALNAFFATDPMVAKLRSTSEKLRELGDIVRSDEIDGKLKAARDEAARTLRDRKDLYEEGDNVVRFGQHRFSVNTQAIELTLIPREGRPLLHITGTGFFEPVDDPEFETTRDFWEQELVSETAEVYRGEYLAASILFEAERKHAVSKLQEAALDRAALLSLVREHATARYDEGYERGVHDEDATAILEKVLGMYGTADRLRYPAPARAMAALFWAFFDDEQKRETWVRQAQSLRRLRDGFGSTDAVYRLEDELQREIENWIKCIAVPPRPLRGGEGGQRPDEGGSSPGAAHGAGSYLFEEISREPIRLVLSAAATAMTDSFSTRMQEGGHDREFFDDVRALKGNLARGYHTVRAWFDGVVRDEHAVEEAVVNILTHGTISREPSAAIITATASGLLGQHARIVHGSMELRLDEFLSRLAHFSEERVPAYRDYQQARHRVLERERKRLRLSEFEPKVMAAFVRNRLINDVYLPMIGSNLAKQLGEAGAKKRTDLMGLLLLVSPPGYGKTTLMEYIATRLGLVFMKINGPALGHAVRSLDPDEAPNATARQEINKLNLALEMGNNVLLYLDDIQHTHSELLQKFISLCDAQRKIEGVWRGETKTYDLRGKRVCVCMAGNPYTESGEQFRIPDMLANRADVYNLGEVLSGREELFDLSYIENSLTSNAVTAPLLMRDPEDVHKLVRMARGEPVQTDQLSHHYSSVELNEILAVLKKLVKVQQLLSRVNRQYVLSAAQQHAYRTEPPFKLQGSYRNMNKLAEKVLPAMNDEELERLIDDHYAGESQTLTTGAEENLLKLAEIRGRMTDAQRARWEEIRSGFQRQLRIGGSETDPATRVMAEISVVGDRVADITKALAGLGGGVLGVAPSESDLTPYLQKLDETLAALRDLQGAQPPMLPIAAAPPTPAAAEADLISREAYLINGTLLPLLRFMAHRFRGYRAVSDPKIKATIARLERVDNLESLIAALENINVSALATLTEEKRGEKSR